MTQPDPSSHPDAPPPAGYEAALNELQTILSELESDSVDVDVLAGKVARAAELLRYCRERINAAEMQVEAVVAELEDLKVDAGDEAANT